MIYDHASSKSQVLSKRYSSMFIRLVCSPRVREMQAWRGVSKVLTGTGYLCS